MKHESPRTRRLRSDLLGLELLRDESTILDFTVPKLVHPPIPESYIVRFLGRGLWKHAKTGEVFLRDDHEVRIDLGADYPRIMPALSWRTPIFHPNISANGVVCLGGYSTHWAPSLHLDELCTMLWDMVRYHNYDVESPYNREAANWVKTQKAFNFPLDPRPVRNRVAQAESLDEARKPPIVGPALTATAPESRSDDEIVVAESVEEETPDILFID